MLEAADSKQSAQAACDFPQLSGGASRAPPFTESSVIKSSLNFSTLSPRVISLTVAAFLLSPAKRHEYVGASFVGV